MKTRMYIGICICILILLSGCVKTPSVERGKIVELKHCPKTRVCSLDTLHMNEGKLGGAFILGFGGLYGGQETKTYYYVYADTSSGLLLTMLDASKTYVIERDDVEPYYVEAEKCNAYTYTDGRRVMRDCSVFTTYYKLVVPINTIKKEFNGGLK